MTKVITYGTYDLLHFGHIRLLNRAKQLGDYLIVGVTADDFDKNRGKINVQQSLMERVEAVRSTGIADEIIIEEYQGQKIDDIKRYGVDIFTVGSDWKGQFDYLEEYCQVVYLDRTEGVSSSEIRECKRKTRLGIVGNTFGLKKIVNECSYVDGIEVTSICCDHNFICDNEYKIEYFDDYKSMISNVDAVYIASNPTDHYEQIELALNNKVHVLCEPPISLSVSEEKELRVLSMKQGCVLMNAVKTAYSTAYYRLILLCKMGVIGDVVSIEATATSLSNNVFDKNNNCWNSICTWGPTVLLPVFQILGTNYKSMQIVSKLEGITNFYDIFTKIDFVYENAVATVKVGKGVKAEGELIISGTKGYIYVPAPWWKTDYFEVRYEDSSKNKRYFYQLDGEGIRYEIVEFLKNIKQFRNNFYIDDNVSQAICKVIEDFYNQRNFIEIH